MAAASITVSATVFYFLAPSRTRKRAKSEDRRNKNSKKRKGQKQSASDDETSNQDDSSFLKDSTYTPGRESSVLEDSEEEEIKRPS